MSTIKTTSETMDVKHQAHNPPDGLHDGAEGMFTDNREAHRFEYALPTGTAYATYRVDGKMLYINYVEAPPSLRGTGAAGTLMRHIVAEAGRQELDITPICGYAVSWMKRHNIPHH